MTNQHRKRIFILPSWYPNKDTNDGSFFREQAQLLSENGFDIVILYVVQIHTQNYLNQKLRRLFNDTKNNLSNNFLLQNPDAYSYPCIVQKDWSDEKKMERINKAYYKAYKMLVDKLGWTPDLFHVQSMFRAGISAKYISDFTGIPYVVTEHSPFNINKHNAYYSQQLLSVLKSADKVTGVSHFHKNQLEGAKSGQDIRVLWNLVDENQFTLNQKRDNKAFVICTISRASYVKDPILFLKSIKNFLAQLACSDDIEINIIGIGDFSDIVNMKHCTKNDIELVEDVITRINFLGNLDRQQLVGQLSYTDVFVSTSIDEPFGIAIREAMLMGVPVISTKSGGPEDSIDEQNGYLVEKGDHLSISNALLEIYTKEKVFDPRYIRQSIIKQSGRTAFIDRMKEFYSPNLLQLRK